MKAVSFGLNNGQTQMVGVCGNITGQVAATGVGQGCVVVDSQGIGWTRSYGGGLGFGATLSGTVGLEASNGRIEDQAGDGAFINPALGMGGRLDGIASGGMDNNGVPTGIYTAGLNIGASAGGTLGTVGGTYTEVGRWYNW